MGSTTIIYGVVALAVAIVFLCLGFFWGRSNVKAKVEQALEQEHSALDAREFAMRRQLDEAIAEIARLRTRADELGRLREPIRGEQLKSEKTESEFNTGLNDGAGMPSAHQEQPGETPESAPASADNAIHALLQSIEEPQNSLDEPAPQMDQVQIAQPDAHPSTVETESTVPPVLEDQPTLPQVFESGPTVSQSPEPEPNTSHLAVEKTTAALPADPEAPVADEWQEFARSLASLTGRKQ